MRVLKHWYALSREVVDAPSIEVLKDKLNGALNNPGLVNDISAHGTKVLSFML